jgi:hypothetical protein
MGPTVPIGYLLGAHNVMHVASHEHIMCVMMSLIIIIEQFHLKTKKKTQKEKKKGLSLQRKGYKVS